MLLWNDLHFYFSFFLKGYRKGTRNHPINSLLSKRVSLYHICDGIGYKNRRLKGYEGMGILLVNEANDKQYIIQLDSTVIYYNLLLLYNG